MESTGPNVLRWTPSPSPTRPLRGEFHVNIDGKDDDQSGSNNNITRKISRSSSLRKYFPFSISTTPPGPDDNQVTVTAETPEFGEDYGGKGGVSLTWKDLWVTVGDGKGKQLSILQGVTGYAQPGQVLAIMGPSGCGKSTLLDALAGRLNSNVKQTGDILINGRKQRLAFGTSAYVTQDDTLMTTLTVKEAVYYSVLDFMLAGKANNVEQGDEVSKAEEAIKVLANTYASSQTYQNVQNRILDICAQGGGSTKSRRTNASFLTQSVVLTKRSFVNMYRDLGYYWLRLGVYIALCLCVGTIFHNIGHSFGSIQARGAMLFFVAGFLTFMAIGGFPSFVEDMKIFQRERLNGHYGVGVYVIGNTISSIPYLLINSIIPGAMAYYLVGLQRGFDHFVFFALVLFVSTMLVESLMMIVASLVPHFLMGIITGAGIQGVMMLNGGFFRLPNDLPKPFWRYPIYYISFHKYATQAFFKNEFKGLSFPNNQVGGPATITGDEVLRNFWQIEMGYSKWVDLAILMGMVVVYRLMFFGIIKLTEKIKPIIASLKS